MKFIQLLAAILTATVLSAAEMSPVFSSDAFTVLNIAPFQPGSIGTEKCVPAHTSAPLMTFSVPELTEDSAVVEVCPDAPVEITFLDLQVRPVQ